MEKIVFILLLCVSCSIADSPKKNEEAQLCGARACWIDSLDNFCKEPFLCAVGVGSGKNISTANARDELAKIFSVKVDSSSEYDTQTLSKINSEYPELISSKESVSKNIVETTSVVIEGAFVAEQFDDKNEVYTLIKLDKNKAASIIKSKMEDLDSKISHYVKMNKRGHLKSAIILLKDRSDLSLRYQFLSGHRFKGLYSLSNVYKKYRDKLLNPILLNIYDKSVPKEVSGPIRSILGKSGVKISNKVDLNLPSIYLSLKKKKEYLKVEGFIKYHFIFICESKDRDGRVLDTFTIDSYVTARNLKQIDEKINENILEEVNNRFDEFIFD